MRSVPTAPFVSSGGDNSRAGPVWSVEGIWWKRRGTSTAAWLPKCLVGSSLGAVANGKTSPLHSEPLAAGVWQAPATMLPRGRWRARRRGWPLCHRNEHDRAFARVRRLLDLEVLQLIVC